MNRLLFTLLLAGPAAALDFHDRDAVVAAALESHPTVTRMRAEAEAARERVTPSASLPNPMLMAGVQNKQVDLRNDEMMTMYMVGVSQTLVRPDRREALRAAAELEARAAEKLLDSAREELRRDVLLAWYDLAAADAQLGAIAQVREMIDAVVAAARVRYEVGTAMQSEVIRAQLQASDLEHETLRLRGMRRAALARLLPLVGLPLETEVAALVALSGKEPSADAAFSSAIGGSFAVYAAQDDRLDGHAVLVALEADVARAEEGIRLAKLERRPDVDLEAQYGHRPVQRDMFSVVARVELPLRGKQLSEPRVREAMLRRDAARARIEEERRALVTAMNAAYVAHEDAANQLKFHHEVLMPQSQLAFESTLAAYQTGKAPFDSILTTQADYLRLRLQYLELLARQAQAVVRYEALRRGARGGA